MPQLLKTLTDKHGRTYTQIYFEPEQNLIYSKSMGKLTLEEIKRSALAYLDVLEQVPCAKLLADTSEMETSWQTLNDWVENIWTPQAIALQLQYMALVIPPFFFVKLSAVDLTKRIQNKLDIRIFNDQHSAQSWLAEV